MSPVSCLGCMRHRQLPARVRGRSSGPRGPDRARPAPGRPRYPQPRQERANERPGHLVAAGRQYASRLALTDNLGRLRALCPASPDQPTWCRCRGCPCRRRGCAGSCAAGTRAPRIGAERELQDGHAGEAECLRSASTSGVITPRSSAMNGSGRRARADRASNSAAPGPGIQRPPTPCRRPPAPPSTPRTRGSDRGERGRRVRASSGSARSTRRSHPSSRSQS